MTVTSILAEAVSDRAVMVVEPSATAVTSPLAFTVATDEALLDQATAASTMTSPLAS